MEPLTIKTPYAVIKQHTPDHVMTAGSGPHAMARSMPSTHPSKSCRPAPEVAHREDLCTVRDQKGR